MGCDLGGADLKGAILIGTKLEFATLDGADMTGVLTDQAVGKDRRACAASAASVNAPAEPR